MPIAVSCPHCSAKLNVPDSAIGKKVKCPKCAAQLTVGSTEFEPPPPPVVAPVEADEAPAGAAPAERAGSRSGPARPGKGSKWLIIGIIIGAVALAGLCCCGGGIALYFAIPETNDKLTVANVQQLKTDMTLAQVEAIVGPGKPASIGDVEDTVERDSRKSFPALRSGYETEVNKGNVYRWKNGRNSSLIIVFNGPPKSGGKVKSLLYTEKKGNASQTIEASRN